MTSPIMLTIRAAAERASVPVAAMRRWVAEGSIYSVRSGSRFYVSWASVVRFLGCEDSELSHSTMYQEK